MGNLRTAVKFNLYPKHCLLLWIWFFMDHNSKIITPSLNQLLKYHRFLQQHHKPTGSTVGHQTDREPPLQVWLRISIYETNISCSHTVTYIYTQVAILIFSLSNAFWEGKLCLKNSTPSEDLMTFQCSVKNEWNHHGDRCGEGDLTIVALKSSLCLSTSICSHTDFTYT